MDIPNGSTAALIERAADAWRRISGAQRELLEIFAELDRRSVWFDAGAHDMPHWVGNAFGLSRYRATRWLDAGHALQELPRIAEAFERGDLSVYKVEELARFATPEDEDALVEWAMDESSGAIKAEADRRRGNDAEEIATIEERRWLGWRYDDEGRSFTLQAGLSSADGAVVAEAIDGLVREIPPMPGEGTEQLIGTRRADALVTLCSTRLGQADPDRTTVVVHAQLDALLGQLHKRSPPLDDTVRAAFDAVLRAPARLILVAQRDDRLVGTLDLFAIDNLTRGGRPWAGVENVVVDAGHRGRGVGGAMLSAAVSIARAARCTSCS